MSTLDKDEYRIIGKSMHCISICTIYGGGNNYWDYRLYYNEETDSFYETSYTTLQAYKRYGLNPYRKLDVKVLTETNLWYSKNFAHILYDIVGMLSRHSCRF